jgi:hypothetical protein
VGAPFGVPVAVVPALGVVGTFTGVAAADVEIAETDALGAGCRGSSPPEPGEPLHAASGIVAARTIKPSHRRGVLAICLIAANTPDTVSDREPAGGKSWSTESAADAVADVCSLRRVDHPNNF